MIKVLKLTLIITTLAIAATAQQHPNLARGFDPEKLYQFDGIDNVNVFNGNLIITIPIGQRYPVSTTLSYGLTLVYNGNPWNHYPETESVPSRFANAGLGWQLTMGELVGPNDPQATWHGTYGSWVYTYPDGAERIVYPYLHPEEIGTVYEGKPNPQPNDVVGYTRDASYIRMTRLAPIITRHLPSDSGQLTLWRARYRLEFPDGTFHIFESAQGITTSSDDNPPSYFDELSLRFMLSRIEDRFGNYVQVSYVPSGFNTVWEITDSVGRTQRVTTRNLSFGQFQGTAQSRHTVQQVDLTAFDGATATYKFEYESNVTISAPCATWPPRYDANGKPVSRATTTRYLRKIILPDLSEFTMPEYQPLSYYPEDGTTINCSMFSGHIRKLTLPTGGAIAYEPGIRRFPGVREEQGGVNGTIGPVTELAAGVGKRSFVDESGNTIASWTYKSYLRNLATYTTGGPASTASVARESVVTVTETDFRAPAPDIVKSRTTAYYFNVWKGGGDFTYTSGANVCYPGGSEREYGRPFTRSYGTNVGDFLLSTETFDADCVAWDNGPLVNGCYSRGKCRTPSGAWVEPLRRGYVAYDSDTFAQPAIGTAGRETDQNLRLSGTRTGFLDSGNDDVEDRFTQTRYADFDGLGHYRTEMQAHDFDAVSATRTVTTRYNANTVAGTYSANAGSNPNLYMVAPWSPWILNTFDRVTTSQTAGTSAVAGSAIEDFCFDRSSGFLQRKRTLGGATSDRTDLLVTYEHVNGNVTAENYYGGDVQPLPAAFGTCGDALATSGRGYRINYGYSFGVRSSSEYEDSGFKSLDLDIDFSTGLPSASRDVAGVVTSYRYDSTGRITEQRPHGDAWTAIAYDTNARPASVNVKRNSLAGATLTENWYYFDGMGRLTMTKDRMPDAPSGAQQWATKRTFYGGTGKTTYATVSFYRSSPAWEITPAQYATSFAYDPFGRKLSVTPPDGKITQYSYLGAREVKRTVPIATGVTADDPVESNAETVEIYDGFGRLVSVREMSGASGGSVETSYVYDVANRMVGVTTVDKRNTPTANDDVTQQRSFTYDNRGFLLTERHPEKGAFGNGDVSYSGYDARGHATRKVEGASGGRFDVTFQYDSAERVRFVRDLAPDGTRRTLKEFVYATSSNPAGATTTGSDLAKGKLRTATRHNHDDAPGSLGSVAVTETYYYNGRAGRIGQKTVDVSATSAFSGASFVQTQSYDELGSIDAMTYPTTASAPNFRSISYVYTNGLLTSVPGYASITYQANGLVASVVHAGGMTETWDPDPRGMPRPYRIRVTTPSGMLWTQGEFAFDGAGNPVQIGPRSYRYDGVGRLVQEQLVLSYQPIGTRQTVQYRYDAFGNRTARSWAGFTGDAFARGMEAVDVDSGTNHLRQAQYDDAGNVVRYAGASMRYDAGGVMTARAVDGGSDVRYLYDANDERIAIVERVFAHDWSIRNRTTWTMRGTGHELLRSFRDDATSGNRSWSVLEDQVWRGSALLAAIDAAATKHYGLDHLGTPRAITNGSGQRLGEQDFDAFGKGGALGAGSLQFTAHERDWGFARTSGDPLDYMHARYAPAGDGRFLTIDPAAGNPSNPQSWNRYTYALNSPLKYVDPDGREVYYLDEHSQKLFTKLENKYPKVRETLDLYRGDGKPDIKISRGNAGSDLDGTTPATGVYKPNIDWSTDFEAMKADGLPIDGSSLEHVYPESGKYVVLGPRGLIDAELIISDQLRKDSREEEETALHELGHADFDARNPLDAVRLSAKDATHDRKGKLIEHDSRPLEKEADKYAKEAKKRNKKK